MAFFEFLGAATWAGVIAPDIFQRIAHRFLVAVVAMRAVHVTVIMLVAVIVVAVWAVDVGLLSHDAHSGM